MTVALVCGSLEIGADGVGDYSRRLAAAMIQAGLHAGVIALHDPHANYSTTTVHHQQCDGIEVPVLRLHATLPWATRVTQARRQLTAWGSRLLSLQFVPFAYDSRGLPWSLPSVIRALLDHPNPTTHGLAFHLMFHEIWIGVARSSSMRDRLIGRLQRSIVDDLCRRCPALAVHTSNRPYQLCLQTIGLPTELLPLYSNLPLLEEQATPPKAACPGYFSGCVFGRIPPQWDPDPALRVLIRQAEAAGLAPRLLLVGRSHAPEGWLERVRRRWPRICIEAHGAEGSPARLAELIQGCQLGLATSPWALVEKSGAVAAFISLGLTVLVSREDWQLRDRWAQGCHYLPEPCMNMLPLSTWIAKDAVETGVRGAIWPVNSPRQVAERLMNQFHIT
ncbi:MAG: hypothetical protein VKN56_10705 [Cyanobacteriota bacterium]|nr:hypothetical protein [Cyanobacteriota bacterium]